MKFKQFFGGRKFIALCVALLLFVSVFTGCVAEPIDDKAVIGVAWRGDTDSEFYTNIVTAVKEAGGEAVLLDQVIAGYLAYDNKILSGASDSVGSLTLDAAEKVKENLWNNTNIETVMKNVDAVIFTGGEDISSSLYADPEPWHGIEAEIDYNATRDVSDYILMAYCIENNIPSVGFCRGMQMLAVVGGAKIIQDIPTYFNNLDKEYMYQHRNEKKTPDAYRDYAPHNVSVAEDSLAYEVFKTQTLTDCPSWHHQAVLNVDNTNLIVSGTTETNSENMIEILEYKGKDFIMGLQFHPEAAVVKHLNGAENASDFMDIDTAMLIFEALLDNVRSK